MWDKQLVQALEKQYLEIELLLKKDSSSPEFKGWKTWTSRLIERVFWKESSHLADFKNIRYSPGIYFGDMSDKIKQSYIKWLETATYILKSLIDELKEFGLSNEEIKTKKDWWNNVTVNLNQTLNINIKNILENNLTVNQYKSLNEILNISDKKEKISKLDEFLVSLGTSTVLELLKNTLLWI